MFEIIMLLGFLLAATSQIRREESHKSKDDNEPWEATSLPIKTGLLCHNQQRRRFPKRHPHTNLRAA